MDKLFGNLYLYEIVLLFLGAFLFMILCGALVYYVVKHQNIKKLLFFFAIPIIMIGYPSIQEIQIESDKIAIKKFKERIRENPNDSVALKQTEILIGKLESRAKTTEDIAVISEAYLLLEKPDKAIVLADKAINKEKNSTTNKTTDKNLKTLVDYKKAAEFQKDIKTNKISTQDTVQIKSRLQKMKSLNSKTLQYFNKKYIPVKTLKLKPKN